MIMITTATDLPVVAQYAINWKLKKDGLRLVFDNNSFDKFICAKFHYGYVFFFLPNFVVIAKGRQDSVPRADQ